MQSIRLDPRKATPYLTLAHVLPVGGSPALFRRALQLDPTQGDVYLWHGDALHKLRYYKQARRSHSLGSSNSRGLLECALPCLALPCLALPCLAWSHLTLPHAQANTAYRAALTLRPGSVRAYLALAKVRQQVSRVSK